MPKNPNALFEKYIGCHSTIEFNGAPVVKAPFDVESEFRKNIESDIQDPETREDLPIIDIAIFQGYNPQDNTFSVQFQKLLTSRGQIFSDEKGDHSDFYGKLYLAGQGEIFTIHSTTDILRVSDSQIRVSLFLKYVDCDSEWRFSYLLESKACYCSQNDCSSN